MPIVEGLEGGEDLEVRVLYVEESTTRRPERSRQKPGMDGRARC